MTYPFLKDSCPYTCFSTCGITLDISRQRLIKTDLDHLIHHAKEIDLQGWFRRMCNGEIVNLSENRAALHTSLRSFDSSAPYFSQMNEVGWGAKSGLVKPVR